MGTTMKITVHSSKSVKPANGDRRSRGDDDNAPSAAATAGSAVDVVIPLTVLDEVTHDEHIPGIFLFHPPAPHSAALEAGLAKMLSEYREWAGRLVVVTDGDDASSTGRRAICLNDAGARFVEASADVALAAVMPLQMGPEAAKLHPSCCDDGGAEADEPLMLVQVTRFPCGSFAVGYSMHHSVADGYTTSTCLLSWGQATRGAAFDPVPVHDRESFFVPRNPPLVEFQHRGSEFKEPGGSTRSGDDGDGEEVIVETAHFSRGFIAQLKSRASSPAPNKQKQKSYSTAQCVVAHLWRCITRARGVDADEVTRLHIAVNGRRGRMTNPQVPEGYTGNVVLWARPAATARELEDVGRTAELVARAVAGVDDRYFRSFIDFASSGGAVEREGLVRTADVSELLASGSDVEVDSVLGFPFYDLDFGTGKPVLFMPTPEPVEGAVFPVPPPPACDGGGGGVVAYVPLFRRAVDAFRRCCYSLPLVAEPRL